MLGGGTKADRRRQYLGDPASFRPHMIGFASIDMPDDFAVRGPSCITDYELEVRMPASTDLLTVLRLGRS